MARKSTGMRRVATVASALLSRVRGRAAVDERPPIVVRRPNFRFDPAASRLWYRQALVPHALSPLFPAGERFFIRSVLAFRDRVHDPVLLEQIRAFVAQEAVHTAAHLDYDASVQPHYDTAAMER